MTTEEVLRAVDMTEIVGSKIPSGMVGKSSQRSRRDFFAYREEPPFVVVMRVTIGTRGGVYGYIFLRNTSISPSIDSIRIGEVYDFTRNGVLPLSEIFWKNDAKTIPEESELVDFLKTKLSELPSDLSYYQDWFHEGYFQTPSNSIRGLQGGAPGLQS